MKTSHDDVVSAIKKSLQESVGKEGGPYVSLKVSPGHMEQMVGGGGGGVGGGWEGGVSQSVPCPSRQVQYEYETSDHSRQEVYERTLESPYTFSLPAQVREGGRGRRGGGGETRFFHLPFELLSVPEAAL